MLLYPQGDVAAQLFLRGHSVCAINCVSAVNLPPERCSGEFILENIAGQKKLDLRAIQKLRTLVLKFQPDVIHCFTPYTLAWTLIASAHLPKRQKSPSIVSFRGITRLLKRWDPTEWMTYKHPRVAWHACESRAVEQAMHRSGCKPSQCNVIYNCVAPAMPTESRDEIRSRWQLSNDDFVVGTVAIMRPIKGLDVLMESAIRLDNPRMRWVVIGSGNDPETTRLSQHPKIKNQVRMLGKINAAANFIHAFDLFVMPSRSEGLCRSLIEAMQQGLPSVVSDAGGMKELIRHGQDGLVVPKEDPDALAQAIDQMFADNTARKLMGESARLRAESMCSTNVFTDRLEAIYGNLRGKKPTTRPVAA